MLIDKEPGMYSETYADWWRASSDAWLLTLEASTVIGMRLATMATGGKVADAEARLMVAEKVQAGWELQTALVTGRLGRTPLAGASATVRHYRGKVAANRRRLGGR